MPYMLYVYAIKRYNSKIISKIKFLLQFIHQPILAFQNVLSAYCEALKQNVKEDTFKNVCVNGDKWSYMVKNGHKWT